MEGWHMNFLILTPKIKFYYHAILILWCLGSSGIATHIYLRWFVNSRINAALIQCIVKLAICIFASLSIPVSALFSSSIWLQMLSIPVGFIGGHLIVSLELFINRYAYRIKSIKS